MRTAILLSIGLAMTVILGCGPEAKDETALAVPERDLTLATAAPHVEIASAVELGQLRAQPRVARQSRAARRPASAPRATRAEARSAPATPAQVIAPTRPVTEFTTPVSDVVNDRELPPGKTITIIPASSGPSSAAEPTDEFPTIERRGGVIRGGRCPPRGRPGIGIAARPRPVLY
jgi:hypothetical protein